MSIVVELGTNAGTGSLSVAEVRREAPADPALDHVGAHVQRELVSLPSWFPAQQAAAILRHKGKAFALVTDKAGVNGVASVESLSCAPPTKSVAWCVVSLGQSVTPDMPSDEALDLMDIYGVDCLPVVGGGTLGGARGGLIVGIVTRQGLAARTPTGSCASHALAA